MSILALIIRYYLSSLGVEIYISQKNDRGLKNKNSFMSLKWRSAKTTQTQVYGGQLGAT